MVHKTVVEFVDTDHIDKADVQRLLDYLPQYNGRALHWTCNCKLMIQYEIYQEWWRHEKDLALVQELKKIMEK